MSQSTMTAPAQVLPQNERAAGVWNLGGNEYDQISRQIADAIEHCVDRLAPVPGERILDLATGTGWTARRVSERSAEVTGVDFSETAISTAIELDPTGGIDFQIGDAESLPFEDGEFDAVISTFGVMFCNDQERAAAELARVCKPGGRVALATWAQHGGVIDMFKLVARYKPQQPAAGPSPFDWGNRDRLEELLGNNFEIGVEEAVSFYRTESGESAWQAFSRGYGPIKTLVDQIGAEAAERLRTDFVDYHESHRTDIGILVQRPYLVTIGTRR